MGTTAAGLLLSAIYLRFGLAAAVACHWTWNSMAGAWTHALGLAEKGGIAAFEGAWKSVGVLAVLSLAVWVLPPMVSKGRGRAGAMPSEPPELSTR